MRQPTSFTYVEPHSAEAPGGDRPVTDLLTPASPTLDQLVERRYVALARLAQSVAVAADFRHLVGAAATALEHASRSGGIGAVRLWAVTSDALEELARWSSADRELPKVRQPELRRAAVHPEPICGPDGNTLVGLRIGGMSIGVLEVIGPDTDAELLGHAAPIIAGRMALLAGQGVGDLPLSSIAIDGATDPEQVMASFAAEAKRLLDHDRLSVYLLTCDGRAFERFSVSSSPVIPGEGVVIPFEDAGLRHVVSGNRPLVSEDLSTDPRIVGREDRVIAGGGFRGLICVPLRSGGRPFGLLNFVSRTVAFYGQDDVPIAEQIADQVSAFISNLSAQDRLRTLIRHEATEAERSRMARELTRAVSGATQAIEGATQALAGRLAHDEEASRAAREVGAVAHLRLADVRRAIAGLALRDIDARSLVEAVEATLAEIGERDSRFAVTIDGDSARFSSAARRGAYRIFQEAVSNARLHSGGQKIEILLRAGRDLELVVTDDGVGFEPDDVPTKDGGGISFMRERARALGGLLTIESAPGQGTTVRFQLLDAVSALDVSHRRDTSLGFATDALKLRTFVTAPAGLVRDGILSLLESDEGMRVVGQADTSEATRSRLRQLRPNVLLLDAQLGSGEIARTARAVRTILPACEILLLGESTVDLDELGIAGAVPTSVTGDEIVQAVAAVGRGEPIPAPPRPDDQEADAGLSARELHLLTLVTAGRTNAEIGETLFLATKTVERHVATISSKMGAKNRTHAAAMAVARNLVDVSQLELGER